MSGRGGRDADVARRDARREPTKEPRARRGRALAGEAGLPKYQPDIALRAIDGHLTRTATQVMAWYRLAAQAWSFRSDAQREVLIRQIAAQLGELQGRWLHLRVTTRPYPVHMWAESFDHNALGRMPDVAGALGWDGFLEGEQRHLMGLSMSDKEVFLGVEVSGRGMLDRWVERAAPVLGRVVPKAVRAELEALRSEIGHLDALVAGSGLDAVPASADDLAWLMHRSCALGLPAPRTLAVVPAGAHWEAEDLAGFTDGVEMFQEPYAPTVRVVGRLRSQTVQRNVAVLSIGLMDGLRIPEVDDPWMQHSDRLPFPVEWSARMYVRRPEEVAGELQRQMGKVRSQIRHYTHDHDLDPPMSLARQADRVLEVEDELTTGLTQLNSRLYGWWRIAVSGKDENEAVRRAQQDDPRVREPGDVVGQQPGEHVEHEPAPGSGGQRALPPPGPLGVLLVDEVLGARLGHDAVGVEDARVGAQQVDVPGERGQLGQAGELGQRARRVEQGPARAGAEGLVGDQAGQKAFPAA